MNYFKCFILVLMLSACDTIRLAPNVEIPASLRVPCEPLNKLEGNTGADMLKNIVSNAEVYYKCSDAHNKLIEATAPVKK